MWPPGRLGPTDPHNHRDTHARIQTHTDTLTAECFGLKLAAQRFHFLSLVSSSPTLGATCRSSGGDSEVTWSSEVTLPCAAT